ncbi:MULTISPECIES: hypothetical protein [unclassified Streptomyces]|uniref:hypothetical protein n=1 Tax=unclassified Streptomyces TaxID=2593676 RepID=UPI0036EA04F2
MAGLRHTVAVVALDRDRLHAYAGTMAVRLRSPERPGAPGDGAAGRSPRRGSR